MAASDGDPYVVAWRPAAGRYLVPPVDDDGQPVVPRSAPPDVVTLWAFACAVLWGYYTAASEDDPDRVQA